MPAHTTLSEASLNFKTWLRLVQFSDYVFTITQRDDCLYLQGAFQAECLRTGQPDRVQYTRQWLLHPDMTRSEFVQTVFKCAMTSVEHEAREAFKYRGRAIFGPHYDVEQLFKLCETDEKALEHRGLT